MYVMTSIDLFCLRKELSKDLNIGAIKIFIIIIIIIIIFLLLLLLLYFIIFIINIITEKLINFQNMHASRVILIYNFHKIFTYDLILRRHGTGVN